MRTLVLMNKRRPVFKIFNRAYFIGNVWDAARGMDRINRPFAKGCEVVFWKGILLGKGMDRLRRIEGRLAMGDGQLIGGARLFYLRVNGVAHQLDRLRFPPYARGGSTVAGAVGYPRFLEP